MKGWMFSTLHELCISCSCLCMRWKVCSHSQCGHDWTPKSGEPWLTNGSQILCNYRSHAKAKRACKDAIIHWQSRRTSLTWNSWRVFIAHRRHTTDQATKILLAWQRRYVLPAFTTWKEHSCLAAQKRMVCLSVISRLVHRYYKLRFGQILLSKDPSYTCKTELQLLADWTCPLFLLLLGSCMLYLALEN